MKNSVTLDLPWPDSALSPNSPKRHWRQKQAAKVAAREAGYLIASTLPRPGKPSRWLGPLALALTFCPPRSRQRGLDNLYSSLKSTIDGVCAGLGVDDSQIKTVTLEWGEIKPSGSVAMKISQIKWIDPR